MKFFDEKFDWIKTHIKNVPSDVSLIEYLQINPTIYIDNIEYKIILNKAKSESFIITNEKNKEIVFSYIEGKDIDIENTFKKFAKPKLTQLINKYCTATKLNVDKVALRNQASLWASMSTSGTMSINWRAILLPQKLQEYLICHELAHTKFMNHSTSFWIFLNRICPNAKFYDRQLNKIGKSIFKISRKSL